jgi:hypothetical protein
MKVATTQLADGAQITLKNQENTFTAQQTPMNGTLTDQATVAWNADVNGQVVKVTLGGNRTIGAPTNIIENNMYLLRVHQDAVGGRTMNWNTAYKFAAGTLPVLTTAINSVDIFTFIGGTGDVLYCVGKAMDVKS